MLELLTELEVWGVPPDCLTFAQWRECVHRRLEEIMHTLERERVHPGYGYALRQARAQVCRGLEDA
jgi:hypothetical protein